MLHHRAQTTVGTSMHESMHVYMGGHAAAQRGSAGVHAHAWWNPAGLSLLSWERQGMHGCVSCLPKEVRFCPCNVYPCRRWAGLP
eukprot:365253-Chlamydomonas_euryale.AAC.4